jgi:hypothetical protein
MIRPAYPRLPRYVHDCRRRRYNADSIQGTLSATTIPFPSRPTTSLAFSQTEVSSSTGSSFAEATTSSSEAVATVPPTPVTPGSRTVLYKKDKHDLTSKLPPANLKLPLVPLTDVEIIVFFYNSSSRPVVSVRLYARGGPNVIAQIINEHRVVKPDGYKRNTCSVHCNKAVKTFIRANGEERKKQMSDFFETASDVEATDAIRNEETELPTTCDFPMLGLLNDLIKFPSGGQAGIFTDCVRWCKDNQVDVKVSQAHLIAHALMHGTDPREGLDLHSNMIMNESTQGSKATNDLDTVVLKGKKPAAATVRAVQAYEDISDLTSLSDEEANTSPTQAGKPVEKFVVKSENAGTD